MALIEVDNLTKHFPKRGGLLNQVVAKVHAVNNVSFSVIKGETLGVVGESGCGKSTLGKTIVRLLEPTAGSIKFAQTEISDLSYAALVPVRRRMQMIFQDPNSSLNPRFTVAGVLKEAIRFHKVVPRSEERQYIADLLAKVGLNADDQYKYPHEFSGGQKQRVGVARALAVRPEFIVADEPISALDVSIQAQVLNLLMDLRESQDVSSGGRLTMMFISHDLKVVDHFCDRMLVMYLGHIVEEMSCEDIYHQAKHPYTQALLEAIPIDDPSQRHELTVLEGEVPSPYNPPTGCPFVTRCPIKEERCGREMPPLVEHGGGHRVACWKVEPEGGQAKDV